MKQLSALLADLPFGNTVYNRSRGKIIKKKKIFMIDTLHEVEERILAATCDDETSEKLLADLKAEFKEVSQKRHETVSRLRDVQTKLRFLGKTSDHLRLKQTEVEHTIHGLQKRKEELEQKDADLGDEYTLDNDIATFQQSITTDEQEKETSLQQLKVIETEYRSITKTKETVTREAQSVEEGLKKLNNEIPVLQSKKDSLEQQIQEVNCLQEQLTEERKEEERLNNQWSEKTKQSEDIKQELHDASTKKDAIQGRCMHGQSEKTRLEMEIEEMEGRKERMDALQKELDDAASKRDESVQCLRDQEEKLTIASKESGELEQELEETKTRIGAVKEERVKLEADHKPIVDILSTVKSLKDACHAEQEGHTHLSGQAFTIQKDITTMEIELHYYKNALEEIAQGMAIEG